MSRVLNLILSHQPRAELERVLAWWASYAPAEDMLVAYGGRESEFAQLPDVPRVFISDPRLRISDQQRGKQSHGAIFRAVAQWLEQSPDRSFTHVYYAEFDHLPLVPDLAAKLLQRQEEEAADVLVHALHRVDGTSNVHFLYHLADPEFMKFWRRISVRADKETVLKFLITGSFWSRKAFMAVAAQAEEVAAYVEIYVPTVAHHLGYRLRSFAEQDRCVSTVPSPELTIERARQMGCWTVHPIKTLPVEEKSLA